MENGENPKVSGRVKLTGLPNNLKRKRHGKSLSEPRVKLQAAKIALIEAESKFAIAKQEVSIEQVRVDLAGAELASEACLRQLPPGRPQPKTPGVVELLKSQLAAAQKAQRKSMTSSWQEK